MNDQLLDELDRRDARIRKLEAEIARLQAEHEERDHNDLNAAAFASLDDLEYNDMLATIAQQRAVCEAARALVETSPYDTPEGAAPMCHWCSTSIARPHASDCEWVVLRRLLAALPQVAT